MTSNLSVTDQPAWDSSWTSKLQWVSLESRPHQGRWVLMRLVAMKKVPWDDDLKKPVSLSAAGDVPRLFDAVTRLIN
ncbi:hypothetical protein EVAR_17741_1 [Eumeta japonica]|uniref:Uncharacterized protein n=1 Tax=Eumeta variegata TaxID=151549 RepID=A0A4C1TTL9_EUMVA|nr:hypothetical protein EVAR_17741_1 [Eumeta japonica]